MHNKIFNLENVDSSIEWLQQDKTEWTSENEKCKWEHLVV